MPKVLRIWQNLSIMKKLMTVFLIVAAFSGVVGIGSYLQIDALNREINDLADVSARELELTIQMQVTIEAQGRMVEKYMATENPTTRVTLRAQFENYSTTFDEKAIELKQLLPTEEEHQLQEVLTHHTMMDSSVQGTSGLFASMDSYYDITNRTQIDRLLLKFTTKVLDELLKGFKELVDDIEHQNHGGATFYNETVMTSILQLQVRLKELESLVLDYIDGANTRPEFIAAKTIFLNEYNTLILVAQQAENDNSIDNSSGIAKSKLNSIYDHFALQTDGGLSDSFLELAINPISGLFAEYDTKMVALSEAQTTIINFSNHLEANIGALIRLETWVKDKFVEAKDSAGKRVQESIIIIGVFVVASLVAAGTIAVFFSRNISKDLNSVAEYMKMGASGDLQVVETEKHFHQRMSQRQDEVGTLGNAYFQMLDSLRTVLGTMQETSQKVSSTSKELASTAEEISASTEEVSSTMEHIAQGANQQAEIATKAIDAVKLMSNTVDESLQQIEGTSGVIQDIAGQTNMLALNAAIEAARAGEYGRGFGVVADNVRVLAENSRSSATEINTITNNIVTNIGGSVMTIQESVQSIASVTEELSASAEEISSDMEETTASMGEMAAGAQELAQMNESLSAVIDRFKL